MSKHRPVEQRGRMAEGERFDLPSEDDALDFYREFAHLDKARNPSLPLPPKSAKTRELQGVRLTALASQERKPGLSTKLTTRRWRRPDGATPHHRSDSDADADADADKLNPRRPKNRKRH